MASIFRKNFHLCFSKIRCLPTSFSPPLTLENNDNEDDEYFVHIPDHSLIFSNFNSVYDNPSTSSSSTVATTTIIDDLSSSSFSASSATECPDFSAIFASQRLLVSSPGLSNSILDSPSLSSDPRNPQQKLVAGGVPIKKDSPDPYSDFRRSMQEMVDAREKEMKRNQQHFVLGEENDDFSEYLQELLLCYLNLNPKHTHKFIIGAFADLLVSVLSPHCDHSDPGSRSRLL